MLKNYLPIFNESTKKIFFEYIDLLDIPQIDYIAIGIQNIETKNSISLMSRPEWQKHFCENQYANYDPIRRAALYTKRNLIPFGEIDHVDSFGKEIMQKRALMGIKDGIILMQRFQKFNYMITLGTGFSQFDAFSFIKSYHDKLPLVIRDLIKIIEIDAKNFSTQ